MNRSDLFPLAQCYRRSDVPTLTRKEAWAVADVLVLTAQALACLGRPASAIWRAHASARTLGLAPHVRAHLEALLRTVTE